MRLAAVLLVSAALALPAAAQKSSTASAALTDPYVGSFVSDANQSISVHKQGTTYRGTIVAEGVEYPYTARKVGRALVGTFQAQGQGFMFTAAVQGDQMTFIANGETTYLRRGSARAGQRREEPRSAGRSQGATPQAATGQDAQIQRILLSSPWCYMRYSQTLGSTNTERGVYTPDGRLVVTTGHEMVSSGANGTAYGSGNGGSVYRWRVANGDLQLAEQGGEFTPVGLRITQNSNGYPILNVGGKEYSQCN